MTQPPDVEIEEYDDASRPYADDLPDSTLNDENLGHVVYDKAWVEKIRNSTAYRKQRADFRTQCSKMNVPLADGTISRGAPCHICGRAIDYHLRDPHPESWSLDHIKTVKEAPELIMDVSNWAASHLDCNKTRGTDEPIIDIGVPSRDW